MEGGVVRGDEISNGVALARLIRRYSDAINPGLDGRICSQHPARDRRILVQGQVRARLIVVAEIAPQQMMEMGLTKDNHVIKTFPPDRSDQPLRIAVLPRRSR